MAPLANQPVKFLLVGGFVAFVDIGLTYLIVLATGTRIIAVTFGFLCGLITSYLLHAKISFSAPLSPKRQLPRFITLVGLNYFTTICIVLIATYMFNFSTMTGKAISLPVVAVLSYFVSKHWIYCEKNYSEAR
jgi:putative flippase GtrA